MSYTADLSETTNHLAVSCLLSNTRLHVYMRHIYKPREQMHSLTCNVVSNEFLALPWWWQRIKQAMLGRNESALSGTQEEGQTLYTQGTVGSSDCTRKILQNEPGYLHWGGWTMNDVGARGMLRQETDGHYTDNWDAKSHPWQVAWLYIVSADRETGYTYSHFSISI